VLSTLNLKRDLLASKFGFKWVKLYRYVTGRYVQAKEGAVVQHSTVGRYNLNPVVDP
jgi:hypothetical protein